MIGELKILELREKAKTALGNKFSLKDFHNMVLDTGIVPLEILEGQTERLIPLAQVRLYVVGAARGTGRRVCEDCLA